MSTVHIEAVLYLYINIAPLTVHTHQRCFQCKRPRERDKSWENVHANPKLAVKLTDLEMIRNWSICWSVQGFVDCQINSSSCERSRSSDSPPVEN